MVDSVAALFPADVKVWHHYRPLSEYDGRLPYGAFAPKRAERPAEPDDWVLPDLLSGSDYSGDTVHKSNHSEFIKRFGHLDGVREVYGGHGTFAVAIRNDVKNPDLLETLSALRDYPVMDEEALSTLETENEEEAWRNDVRADFERLCRARFGEIAEEWTEESAEEETRALFERARDKANVYWVHETPSSPYIDLERIVKALSPADFTPKPKEA